MVKMVKKVRRRRYLFDSKISVINHNLKSQLRLSPFLY